jgi:hypothetical protein
MANEMSFETPGCDDNTSVLSFAMVEWTAVDMAI